jgi:antitoxin component of MazEF toxin-antitoxin module
MAQVIKVSKWGGSLAIRIPGHVVGQLELKAGDEVRLLYKDNYILLEANKTSMRKFEEWLELFNKGEATTDFTSWLNQSVNQ